MNDELKFDFLKRSQALFKAYRDYPLPVVIASPRWKVYWSNDLARQYYAHITTTPGLEAALSEFDREALLREAVANGSCTIQDIFPLSGVNMNIAPVLEEDEPWGMVLTLLRMDNLIDSKVFYRSTRMAGVLSDSIREIAGEVFSALDAVHLKADLLEAAWMRDSLNAVTGNNYRMLRIAANLSEFGRYQSGLLGLSPQWVDLAGVLRELRDAVAPIARSLDIPMAFDLPEQAVPVNLDRERFEIGFFNVVHNAAYYTRPGNRVEIKLAKGDKIRLTVTDRGLGIPADILPLAVQPYFTYGHGGGARGIGLGLAVADLVARSHEGVMEIHSTSGKGTAVTLTLPPGEWPEVLGLEQPVDSVRMMDRFSSAYSGLMDAALSPFRPR